MIENYIIPIEVTRVQIDPKARRLATGWKSWFCPKCGDGFLYKGKRPSHKRCAGKFKIIDMTKGV